MPLRVLGPLVVLSTLALLGTGVLAVLLGPQSGRAGLAGTPFSPLLLHQASFAVWVVAMTLHVLARVVPALHILTGRVGRGPVEGRAARVAALVLVAALAGWLAVVLYAAVPTWQHDHPFGQRHDGR